MNIVIIQCETHIYQHQKERIKYLTETKMIIQSQEIKKQHNKQAHAWLITQLKKKTSKTKNKIKQIFSKNKQT